MNRFSLLLQHGWEEDTSFGVSVSCLSRLCVLKTSPPKDHVNSMTTKGKVGESGDSWLQPWVISQNWRRQMCKGPWGVRSKISSPCLGSLLLKSPRPIFLLAHPPWAMLRTPWMEAEVHGKRRWILFLDYVTLTSCVERIPWGRRRNKTGQENNSREKVRELSLEWHIYPWGKECRMNWFGKRKWEHWKPKDSRKSFHLWTRKKTVFLVRHTLQNTQKMTRGFHICPGDSFFLIVSYTQIFSLEN